MNKVLFTSLLGLLSQVSFSQETDVIWTQFHKAQQVGNVLERTGIGRGIAISTNVLLGHGPQTFNDGYIKYVADQNSRGRILGFSMIPNNYHVRRELKYSFFFNLPGKVKILEEGVPAGLFNYTIGDEFKISRESGEIVYYINAIEVRRVPVDHTEDLFIEGMLIEDGSILTGVKKSFSALPYNIPIDVNTVNGDIDLTVSGAFAPYSFRWTNGATTEDLTAVDDGIYSVVITDIYGNQMERTVSLSELVTWSGFIKSSEVNGELIKVGIGNWGGAVGTNPLWQNEDGWVEYTLTNVASRRAFGFSLPGQTVERPGDILYGIFITDNYKYKIIENGAYIANFSYNENDVFKVERRGTSILYFKNGELVHSLNLPLRAEYNFAGAVRIGAGLEKVRCYKRIEPYAVDIVVTPTHCTNGNDDGMATFVATPENGTLANYTWYKYDMGNVTVVETGTAFGNSAAENLSDGLYLIHVEDNNGNIGYQYVLIGEEGAQTTVQFHDLNPNGALSFQHNEDAMIRFLTGTGNGTGQFATHGRMSASDNKNNAWYQASLLNYQVIYGEELEFLSANLHLTSEATGHYREDLSVSNQGFISRVNSDWNEQTVSWNSRPTIDLIDQITVPETSDEGFEVRDDDFDLLNFVEYWQQNPQANYGIQLALANYSNTNTKGLEYYSHDNGGSGIRPVYELTFKVKPRLSPSFEIGKDLGTIDVVAPNTGVLPYRYVINLEPIGSLANIWNQIYDSSLDALFEGPLIDSAAFFQGNVNSTNFTFTNLPTNRYYVAVFDNNGQKLMEQEVILSAPFEAVDNVGVSIQDNVWSRATGVTTDASASILMEIPIESSGGFEFEVSEFGDYIIGFQPSSEPKATAVSEFTFGLHMQANGEFNVIENGIEGTNNIASNLNSKIRFIKEGSSISIYVDGIREHNMPYDPLGVDALKTSVVFRGEGAIGLDINFGSFQFPKPGIAITYPECGGDSQGSFAIKLSIFTTINTGTISVINNQTNMVATPTSTYFYDNLEIGTYTVTMEYSISSGPFNSGPLTFIDQVPIGYLTEWENLGVNTQQAAPNEIYQQPATSGSFVHAANGAWKFPSNNDQWVHFDTRMYNYSGTWVHTGSGNQQLIYLGTNSSSVETGLYLADLQNSDLVSIPINNVPVFSWPTFNLSTEAAFRIERIGTNMSIYHESDPTPFYGPLPSTIAGTRVYVRQRYNPSLLRTVSSFCPFARHQYVTPQRKMQGGYYKIPDDGLLRFEFLEEYSLAGDVNFIVRDKMGQNTGLTSSNLSEPTEMFGDNREALDVSGLGPGVYIMDIINDKNEHWYLRFKVD